MDYRQATLDLIKTEFQNAKERKLDELRFLQEWSADSDKLICVFGAGSGGYAVYSAYCKRGINIDYFCDNNSSKWGTRVWGDIECISPNTLLEMREKVVVVISAGTEALEKMYEQLVDMQMPYIVKHSESQLFGELTQKVTDFDVSAEVVEEKMRAVFDILEDKLSQKVLYYRFKYLVSKREEMNQINFGEIYTPDQYFIEGGKYLQKGEGIIDCGAFDGDTLRYLMDCVGYQEFDRYVCYELDPDTFQALQQNTEQYPEELKRRIVLRPYGVGGAKGKVCLDEITGKCGEVVTLDEMELGHKVSFLKMDIEGAELETLQEASKVIEESKPQCAICIYHKISDMWTIPLLLHELLSEYQIIIRHHQYSYSETVCYAIRR